MDGMLDNIRLYQILGLPRTDVSPEDIKRAYRKAATRVHPDRNRGDPNSTAKFQEVQYAYSVLSDPRMRNVYDSYGEQGLKMYESYMSFADGDGGTGLPLANPASLLGLVCCAASIIVGLATALCVTVYMKLQDSSNETPLALMLIPLWVLNTAALVGLCVFTVSGMRRGAGTAELAGPGAMLAQLLLLIAWEVLLVLRTDGGVPTLPFAVVFAPLYVYEALNLCRALPRTTTATYEAEVTAGSTSLSYPMHVVRVLTGSVARAAFLALLTLKLDGTLGGLSYAVVLLPLWLALLVSLLLNCSVLSGGASSTEREQMLLVLARGRVLGVLFLAFLLLLANLVLDHSMSSWLPFFMVPFIFSGCFFCCCCCAVTMLRMVPKPAAQEVPPAIDPGSAGSSDRSSHAADSKPVPSYGSVAADAHATEASPLLAGSGTRTPSPPDEEAV